VGCVGTHSYQAPEILMNVPYTNSVDMWAFGVSIYVLLSAKKPFPKEGQNRALQRSKILNGEYDFYGEAWRHISDDAKDLISKAIQIRPSDRITAEEALEHPWMKSPVINLKTFGERWASKLELSRKVKRSTRSGREAASREDRSRNNNSSRVTQSRPERSQASLYSHRNTPTSTRTTERAERSQASIYSYHRSVEPSRTTDRGTTSTHSRILQSEPVSRPRHETAQHVKSSTRDTSYRRATDSGSDYTSKSYERPTSRYHTSSTSSPSSYTRDRDRDRSTYNSSSNSSSLTRIADRRRY